MPNYNQVFLSLLMNMWYGLKGVPVLHSTRSTQNKWFDMNHGGQKPWEFLGNWQNYRNSTFCSYCHSDPPKASCEKILFLII